MFNNYQINHDIKRIIQIALIIWILCAIFLIVRNWNQVADLALDDTDDLMRYHQYTEWIKNGNWYLQPDPQFNPQDGVIMHWSRVADIPLAGIALVATVFTDWNTAFTISNIVTPLIYLLIIVLIISLISYKLFGLETAKIAMLFPLLAPISYRFLPGALDHHNLQFVLLAFFVLLVTTLKDSESKRRVFSIAFTITLSLWIGLENIYSFAITLLLLAIYGLLRKPSYLQDLKKICLYSSILSVLALLLNRPVNEFFTPQYDVLSFPFVVCFFCAFLVFYVLNTFNLSGCNNIKKLFISCGISVLFFLPVILIYPNLIKGGYSDYPSLLKENWLSNVSEAIPLIKMIFSDKSELANVIAVIPAMISPLFFYKQEKNINYWILYSIFFINLLLSLVWQMRMLFTCIVAVIPLQAYVCFRLREKCFLLVTKTIVLFLCLPTLLFVLSKMALGFNPEKSGNDKYDNIYDSKYISAINLLNRNHIENKMFLSTIDLGAAVIVNSTNSTIAAPYHRNIRGNSEMFNFYLEKDNAKAKDVLIRNKIDYLLLEKDFFNALDSEENKGSMMNRLYNKESVPDYLKFVDENANSTIKLYKFIQE